MTEKTSKITRTVFKNEWANPKGGSIFYHDIELENGDKGSIGSKEKEPAKLNPGNELTYTIEANEKGGFKIKAVNPNGQGGGGFQKKQATSPASFALSYAKDILIASWSEHAPTKMRSEQFFDIAEKMYKWMEERK